MMMSLLSIWQAQGNQEHRKVLFNLAGCLLGGTIAITLAVTDSFASTALTRYGANVVGTITYYLAGQCLIRLYFPHASQAVPVAIATITVLGSVMIRDDNGFYAWHQFMRICFLVHIAAKLYTARDSAAPSLRMLCFALAAFSIVGLTPHLVFLLAAVGHLRMPLVDATTDSAKLQAILWALSPTLVYISIMGVIQARIAHRLRESADVDILTGAYSRRYLIEHGARLLEQREQRTDRCGTSLLLIDVDFFKRVNDTWGHLIGDAVLRHCVSCIRESIRAEDSIVSRYGGEEFCVLLPNTSLHSAELIAQRTRALIASRPYQHGDRDIVITVSIGVAQQESTACTLSSVLSRADEFLYLAKQSGRNKVLSGLTPI